MVTNVKYPTARHDMILYLKDLSDFEMQKREWVDTKYEYAFYSNMRFPIEMLIDEGDLDKKEHAIGKVGWWFYTAEEALKVHKVGTALQRVTHELGRKLPDSIYLNSPLWQEVVQAAKEAYDYIMTYEDMDDLLRQCQEE